MVTGEAFMVDPKVCRICGTETEAMGTKKGSYYERNFELRYCPGCFFAYIANPWTEYEKIYSHDYYAGRGADPTVDYLFELKNPERTVRQYEWRGILTAVRQLIPIGPNTQWLDYGCGNGGLVRYCHLHAGYSIVGFEEGCIRQEAAAEGIPFIDTKQLKERAGTFDIVTAIEVIEHVEDPLMFLRRIHSLLKPGGLFFYTTGNARPFRQRLLSWRYVTPEIHISFFEPQTLDLALKKAGFSTEFKGFMPGFTDIIRFKILKTLGVRIAFAIERMVPWNMVTLAVDKKYRVTAHPIGWA